MKEDQEMPNANAPEKKVLNVEHQWPSDRLVSFRLEGTDLHQLKAEQTQVNDDKAKFEWKLSTELKLSEGNKFVEFSFEAKPKAKNQTARTQWSRLRTWFRWPTRGGGGSGKLTITISQGSSTPQPVVNSAYK